MKTVQKLLFVSVVTLTSNQTQADDREKYYQYLYDQQVTVKQSEVSISFKWSKPGNEIFKAGDEFEIGTIVSPKIFAINFFMTNS